MAFKLRSGNAPKFKMVGSSPLKQEDESLTTSKAEKESGVIGDEESKYTPRKQTQAEIDAEKTALAKLEREEILKYAPWQEATKEKYKEEVDGEPMTEGMGLGTETDLDIAKYKSKAEIKHDAKMRKLKAKEDAEYTDVEKYRGKQRKLADKYQRARGTGEMGVSFDWRNMLLGGGVVSGFKVEPKKDILSRKMKKTSDKRKTQKTREESKKNLRVQKDINRTAKINRKIKEAEEKGKTKKVERLKKKL